MSEEIESAKFYTRARRIPILIGRLHDGTAIPGGPYTITQLAVGGGSALVMAKTTAIWAVFGLLINVVVFVAVVLGLTFLAGRLPSTGRNPIAWAADGLGLLISTPGGVQNGRAMRVARPHAVRHQIAASGGVNATRATTAAPAQTAAVAEEPPAAAAEVVEVAGTAPSQLTGVGRLLASAVAGKDSNHDA